MIEILPDSNSLVCSPKGAFDAECVFVNRPALLEAMNGEVRRVVFDLSEASWIASPALGLMAEVWQLGQEKGVPVEVVSPSEVAQAVLRQTHLDRLFRIESKATEVDQARALFHLNRTMSEEIITLEQLNRALMEVLPSKEPQEVPEVMLRQILKACESERGAFFRWNEKNRTFVRGALVGCSDSTLTAGEIPAPADSPERQAIETRSALYLNASDSRWQQSVLMRLLVFPAAIMAPMCPPQGPVGLFLIQRGPDEDALTMRATPLVMSFASIGALAYEKIRLLAALEERNRKLESLVAELSQKQSALNDSSKLATLGALVSGMGHAFNNRLVPILGYAQLLGKKFAEDPKTNHQLEIVESSAKDLKRMLDRLWSITRSRPPMFEETDLNETVESALLMAEPTLGERQITVERHLGESLPAIPFDRGLMIQAFLSILHRIQFLFPSESAQRTFIVSTRQKDHSGLVAEFLAPSVQLSEEVLLTIQDPLTPLQRIGNEDVFNLSIPASVVSKHGGRFSVNSTPLVGLCIEIVLPFKPRRLETPPALG